jgi:hypothetical protein
MLKEVWGLYYGKGAWYTMMFLFLLAILWSPAALVAAKSRNYYREGDRYVRFDF